MAASSHRLSKVWFRKIRKKKKNNNNNNNNKKGRDVVALTAAASSCCCPGCCQLLPAAATSAAASCCHVSSPQTKQSRPQQTDRQQTAAGTSSSQHASQLSALASFHVRAAREMMKQWLTRGVAGSSQHVVSPAELELNKKEKANLQLNRLLKATINAAACEVPNCSSSRSINLPASSDNVVLQDLFKQDIGAGRPRRLVNMCRNVMLRFSRTKQ